MSTFDWLKAEVVFNTFDGPKYLERAGVYINDAARDVARKSLWGAGETATTTDESGVAPLPVARVTAVWGTDANGRKQERYLFAGDAGSPGVGFSFDADAADEPSYITSMGAAGASTIRVTPVPPYRTLLVAGARLPTLMAAGTDECELGRDVNEALILYARAKLYLREDDKEMHDALMQSYAEEVRRFTLTTRPVAEGPRLTPGTWADGSFGGT